jgi:hypothetical protein
MANGEVYWRFGGMDWDINLVIALCILLAALSTRFYTLSADSNGAKDVD